MEKWIVWLEPIVESFAWIELREMPQWSDGPNPVNRTVNLLIQKKIIQPQDYDQMFIDFGNIKTFLKGQPNIFDEWNKSKLPIQKRWMFIFANLKSSGISFDKFAKVVEYLMMMPG